MTRYWRLGAKHLKRNAQKKNLHQKKQNFIKSSSKEFSFRLKLNVPISEYKLIVGQNNKTFQILSF